MFIGDWFLLNPDKKRSSLYGSIIGQVVQIFNSIENQNAVVQIGALLLSVPFSGVL